MYWMPLCSQAFSSTKSEAANKIAANKKDLPSWNFYAREGRWATVNNKMHN